MRRQAVINRASGTTTGSSLWRIVMPHSAKASAAETVSVATVGRHVDPGRVAAGDHHVAVLEPDEAAVHGAARQDDATLAFAAVAVPAEDVRGFAHPPSPFQVRSRSDLLTLTQL